MVTASDGELGLVRSVKGTMLYLCISLCKNEGNAYLGHRTLMTILCSA